MSAQILDGKVLAAQLKDGLKKEIAAIRQARNQHPRLASIVIGDDPASHSYALSQQRTAEALGIHYELEKLKANVSKAEVIELIGQLNGYDQVHGIMLNKPLPSSLDFQTLVEMINPAKDIEGMTLTNLGRLVSGTAAILPSTPAAAIALLKSTGVVLKGKEAVVVGRSEIVGKPVALMLLKEDVTVTVCHSKTVNLQGHLREADIVVAALGNPLFLKGSWLKPGAIVIDVGINSQEGKIVGDVDFASACTTAGFITPVPGGVGPVTSAMLMRNVFEAFKNQLGVRIS